MPSPSRRQPRRHEQERKCEYCNKNIPSDKRSDAKYCTDRCRYDAWLERHNAS